MRLLLVASVFMWSLATSLGLSLTAEPSTEKIVELACTKMHTTYIQSTSWLFLALAGLLRK